MALNIANCPRCGKVFAKGMKDICPLCVKEIDEEFDRCSKYLKENRGTTLQELSDATEVPIKQITRFIIENRLIIDKAPNMGYPCEICGNPIREKYVCDSCRQRLSRDVAEIIEKEQHKQDSGRQHNSPGGYQIRDRR
jgi:flagellar operon protein (TIGR03826 family)